MCDKNGKGCFFIRKVNENVFHFDGSNGFPCLMCASRHFSVSNRPCVSATEVVCIWSDYKEEYLCCSVTLSGEIYGEPNKYILKKFGIVVVGVDNKKKRHGL